MSSSEERQRDLSRRTLRQAVKEDSGFTGPQRKWLNIMAMKSVGVRCRELDGGR